MISPQGEIRLLNVPLDSTNKNQIYFSSTSNQYTYMNGKTVKSYSDYTYIRKDSSIKVKATLDNLWNVNYVMYQNGGFNSKWFYAYITNKEYISENVVLLSLECDVWQTWFSEVNLKNSFIERSHVSVADDVAGNYLVDEGLELGDYVDKSVYDLIDTTNLCCVIAATIDINDYPTFGSTYGSEGIGNMYSGIAYYLCRPSEYIFLGTRLSQIDDEGKGDAILSIHMAPLALFTYVGTIGAGNYLPRINGLNDLTFDVSKIITGDLDGYTPKNNKMYTYPYNFLGITNYGGGFASYKFEKFSTTDCTFDVSGNLGTNQSVRITPKNYKGNTLNYDEGLLLSNYPLAGWVSGIYPNWIAQNQNQIALGAVSNVLSSGVGIAAGMMSGNPLMVAGAAGSGLANIAGTIAKISDTKVLPDQAKGSTNSSINVADSKQTFGAILKTIDGEHAKIIDNYFDMFGYKINKVETPVINSRTYWNYIKTIDCNITGNAPQEDIIRIKNMFNVGVTFWSNGDNIGDYSLDNTI